MAVLTSSWFRVPMVFKAQEHPWLSFNSQSFMPKEWERRRVKGKGWRVEGLGAWGRVRVRAMVRVRVKVRSVARDAQKKSDVQDKD